MSKSHPCPVNPPLYFISMLLQILLRQHKILVEIIWHSESLEIGSLSFSKNFASGMEWGEQPSDKSQVATQFLKYPS